MLSSGSLWCSKRVKYAQRTDATWIHCRALPQKAVLFQRTVWTSYFEHENKPCHMFPKSGGNSAEVPAGLLREFAPEMSWGQLHGEQFDPRRFHPKRPPGCRAIFGPVQVAISLRHLNTFLRNCEILAQILARWFLMCFGSLFLCSVSLRRTLHFGTRRACCGTGEVASALSNRFETFSSSAQTAQPICFPCCSRWFWSLGILGTPAWPGVILTCETCFIARSKSEAQVWSVQAVKRFREDILYATMLLGRCH